MDILISIVSFVVVLSVVVFIHEMGHFLVARFFSVKVDSFSIGFGSEIFGWTDSVGTRWRVGWLPLGGYVKFHGDENATSMPSAEKIEELRASGDDRADIFHFKPLYQRALVVAAGPFANFLLAVVIFAMLAMTLGEQFTVPRVDYVRDGSPAAEAGIEPGDVIARINGARIDRFEEIREQEILGANIPLSLDIDRGGRALSRTVTPAEVAITDPFGTERQVGSLGIRPRAWMAVVGSVQPGSAADQAGLMAGDWILAIDGAPIESFGDLSRIVSRSAGAALTLTVDRMGRPVTLSATPEPRERAAEDGTVQQVGVLGITSGQREGDVSRERYGPFSATWRGIERTGAVITQTLSYLGNVVTGAQSADQLSGPIGIARISGQVASVNLIALIELVALLSVSIGLINLFPVPILDGGHLVFYAYEAVAGKPLSEQAQEIGFRIGLVLVLALMVFATWNDIRAL